MILADKIIEERKRLGMSQEELADRLAVSRQAVSKWENAQSIPDLQKIIMMSELFSVSTDYLLKDDMAAESRLAAEPASETELRRVSIEEANDFINAMAEQSRTVALGVLLCITSPVLLVALCGLAQAGIAGITEVFACAVGLTVLFVMIAVAVFLFVRNAGRTERFDYLDKEIFETAYGVSGLVKEKKAAFEPIYARFLALGVILCVLSPLPVIITALLNRGSYLVVLMAGLLICIVAAGVYIIIRVATVHAGYQILLQEGDYNKRDKKKSTAVSTASAIYWSLAVAVYLTWSFLTGDWDHTWVIWPIAGIICAPVMLLVKRFGKENE